VFPVAEVVPSGLIVEINGCLVDAVPFPDRAGCVLNTSGLPVDGRLSVAVTGFEYVPDELIRGVASLVTGFCTVVTEGLV
jgi:hypothetical protein